MGIFNKSKVKIHRDGGVIGIPFGYVPIRDPRLQPVETSDLAPGIESGISASDEFYAKFHSLVINNRIDISVYNSQARIEQNDLTEYKKIYLGDVDYSRFSRAAMTGYLMAVCEENVFKTFRHNEMATYLIEAMQTYIRDVEREVSIEVQKVLLTGLLSGYHLAHKLYKKA